MTRPERPSDDEVDALFRELAETGSRRTRNRIVEAHLGFGVYMARRYVNRGVSEEDLRQVALLALVKAVDRFDPDRGVRFSTFAGRTVEGEIKRHFRDKTWAVRVPRSAKNLHLDVRRAQDALGQELGRSPTVRELAAHLEIDTDEVVQALTASAAYTPDSFDAPSPDGGDRADRAAALADREDGFAETDDRLAVDELLDALDERERRIVELRFYGNMTQSQIAERMGISQMHVSRLLRQSFATMRSAAER